MVILSLGVMEMDVYEYQERSKRTAKKLDNKGMQDFQYMAGMLGELGEISEHIKKHYFQGFQLDNDSLKLELGDLMWYMANFCTFHNIELEEVLLLNIEKLKKRYPKGFYKRGDAIESHQREEL